MTELSNQDKQLLLDYCLGIAPEDQVTYIEGLLASNPQAAGSMPPSKARSHRYRRSSPNPAPTIWSRRRGQAKGGGGAGTSPPTARCRTGTARHP